MEANVEPKQLIVRYFLGELGEEDQQYVEGRYFTDPDFLEHMQAIEAELIEDYLKGGLPFDTAQKVARLLSASQFQQKKVELADSLLRALEVQDKRHQPSGISGIKPWLQSRYHVFPSLVPTRKLVMVAAVIALILGSGWLVFEIRQLRRQVEEIERVQVEARQREQDLQEVIADLQKRQNEQTNNKTQNQIIGQTDTNNQYQPRQSNKGEQGKSPDPLSGSKFSTLLLSPVLLRNSQEAPKMLNIPKDVETVQFQLILEEGHHSEYYAVLETADGEYVRTEKRLHASQHSGKKVVTAVFPSKLLESKTYIITLQAPNATGGTEDISRYTFKANKL